MCAINVVEINILINSRLFPYKFNSSTSYNCKDAHVSSALKGGMGLRGIIIA
jgi:hypothetical protein